MRIYPVKSASRNIFPNTQDARHGFGKQGQIQEDSGVGIHQSVETIVGLLDAGLNPHQHIGGLSRCGIRRPLHPFQTRNV